jgi:hypothetical protein
MHKQSHFALLPECSCAQQLSYPRRVVPAAVMIVIRIGRPTFHQSRRHLCCHLPRAQYVHPAIKAQVTQVRADAQCVIKANTARTRTPTQIRVLHVGQGTVLQRRVLLERMRLHVTCVLLVTKVQATQEQVDAQHVIKENTARTRTPTQIRVLHVGQGTARRAKAPGEPMMLLVRYATLRTTLARPWMELVAVIVSQVRQTVLETRPSVSLLVTIV